MEKKLEEFEVVGKPSWIDENKRLIVDIIRDGKVSSYITAATDPDERGRKLFEDCVAGIHGVFVEWVEKTDRQLWEEKYNTDPVGCKEALCDEADVFFKTVKLLAGFEFTGKHIQTDEPARNNAAGYLNTLVAGITEILPIVWRTEENEFLSFASLEEYKPFAMAFVTFVKDAYASIFLVKDAIRTASSFDDAWSKYSAYKNVK